MNLHLRLTRDLLVVEYTHHRNYPGPFLDLVAREHADREAHQSGYLDAGMPIRTELVECSADTQRTRWTFQLPRARLHAV